jgi:uncharacterized protein YprB with RNaseH-like and TPR domain
MRYLILDIETLPHPDANQWLEPVQAAANLKDPAKVEASIKERQAERDDKLGLDPDCCVIAALGYHVVGRSEPCCDVTLGSEKAEGVALEQLAWELTRDANTKIVTFYGRQFDLPVLMRRAMYLGVKFPALNLDRYRSPHIDLWDVLTYHGALRTAHSLKFYAKRMGFTTLDKVDGGDVRALAAAGNWDAIRDHCLSDVGLTHALANKFKLLEV